MRQFQRLALVLLLGVIVGMAGLAVRQPTQGPQQDKSSTEAHQKHPAQEEKESLWHPSTYEPITALTVALVAFTAVLASVSIIQIRFLTRADETARIAADASSKQADIGAKQFALSQTDYIDNKRPWVSVKDIVPDINLVAGPDKSFHINVVVGLQNHGSTPATEVKIMMEFANLENIQERQRWLSENFRRQRDQPGYVVFPTQTKSVWSQMSSRTSPGYIFSGIAHEQDFINGVVIGCVDYKFIGNSYGQTFFSFCMCDREVTGALMANYGYLIGNSAPGVPKERITFIPFAWGNSAV